jgi:hypothetical protein
LAYNDWFLFNRARLSTGSSNDNINPEISGYGEGLIVVWQYKNNGGDYDIHHYYHNADGDPSRGMWVRLWGGTQPAATPGVDEINPDAASSRNYNHGGAGVYRDIHVVYQKWNSWLNIWEVYHTWGPNIGGGWRNPVLLSTQDTSAKNPACVYTEELNGPFGYTVQVVWEEDGDIKYRSFYYDTRSGLKTGYYPAIGTNPIKLNIVNSVNHYPKIASIDDRSTNANDYYFHVVWEQSGTRVIYTDGFLKISPAPFTLIRSSPKKISPDRRWGFDSHKATRPDISATQDNQTDETFYINVVVEYWTSTAGSSIESIYYYGTNPTPGANALFPMPWSIAGPSPTQTFNKPSIGSKLTNKYLSTTGIMRMFFSTIAWEDNTGSLGTLPDIGVMGFDLDYLAGPPGPPPGGWGPPIPPVVFHPTLIAYGNIRSIPPSNTVDNNPEVWNRNDHSRNYPPFSHIVWDYLDSSPNPNSQQIEYADP